MRPAFDALFDIDEAMGSVVASATQPTIGAVKLAWWRDALEKLDFQAPPPEPRLKAAAKELVPLGISGAELAEIEEGWATLLEEWPNAELVRKRGARIFGLAARILQVSQVGLADAGALWAIANVARRKNDEGWLAAADRMGGLKFPAESRRITAMAALASRDLSRVKKGLEPEATPGRALALIRHRLSGRFPR